MSASLGSPPSEGLGEVFGEGLPGRCLRHWAHGLGEVSMGEFFNDFVL